MDYAVRNEKTWRQSLISFGGSQYRRSILFRCWANTDIRCSIDTNGSNLGRTAVGSKKENIGSFISRYRRQPAQSVCLSRRMVRRDLLGSRTIYSVRLKCLILLTQFFPPPPVRYSFHVDIKVTACFLSKRHFGWIVSTCCFVMATAANRASPAHGWSVYHIVVPFLEAACWAGITTDTIRPRHYHQHTRPPTDYKQ